MAYFIRVGNKIQSKAHAHHHYNFIKFDIPF